MRFGGGGPDGGTFWYNNYDQAYFVQIDPSVGLSTAKASATSR